MPWEELGVYAIELAKKTSWFNLMRDGLCRIYEKGTPVTCKGCCHEVPQDLHCGVGLVTIASCVLCTGLNLAIVFWSAEYTFFALNM